MVGNKKLRYTLGGNNVEQAEESWASKRDRYNKLLGAYSYKNNPQNASPILSFKKYIDQFTEDSKVQGFDMRKINGLIGNSIANMAIANEDPYMLNLIDLIQTGPNSYYSNTSEAQDLVLKAKSEINRLRDAREDRDWTLHQRGRTFGVQHYNQKIGAEKKLYYDGEITWQEFQERVRPIFSEMSGQGFTDLVDTWETRIRNENDNREKRDADAIVIGVDSERADEVLKMAMESQSENEIYKWQVQEGVSLTPEFREIVGSIITENQGEHFNFMNTAEYKESASRIDDTFKAPGVELSQVDKILEGIQGIVRDATPPQYFKVKSQIISKINQRLAKRFRQILALPKGNRTYQTFTEEQSRLWTEALAEIPFQNMEADMQRLKNVMDNYNEQVKKDAAVARKREASQLSVPELDEILGIDSGGGGRMLGSKVYLDQLQYQINTIHEPRVGIGDIGFGRNALGTYLDNLAKSAGYEGIEDPRAEDLIKDEFKYIQNEIMRLTK